MQPVEKYRLVTNHHKMVTITQNHHKMCHIQTNSHIGRNFLKTLKSCSGIFSRIQNFLCVKIEVSKRFQKL